MKTRILPCVVARFGSCQLNLPWPFRRLPPSLPRPGSGWRRRSRTARTSKASKPFFSFTYDGKPSAELLGTWKLKRASRPLDSRRTEHTLTYTDPKTGLELRCVGVEFRDFPAVEWTLYFKNTSDRDTPILSDILTLDVQFGQGAGGECVLEP